MTTECKLGFLSTLSYCCVLSKYEYLSARAVFIVLWVVNFPLTFPISLISTAKPYLTKEFVSGTNVEAATMEAYGILLSFGFV